MRIAVLITGQFRDYKVNYLNHMKHLIECNKADVFVYASTKNTLHSCGKSLEQKYYLTNEYTEQEISQEVTAIYGNHLKGLKVQHNENLPDEGFGTLGYFRTRMQNQIDNIGHGFGMAKEYSHKKNFSYDIVVRCRPDNSMFPKRLNLSKIECSDNLIYSTKFTPSGHRDLCFFAMANPETFEKYCSFRYLEGEDPSRTDNNFTCTEHMWEEYLKSLGVKTLYIPDVCRPFTGFYKQRPIEDFPYRVKDAKLIDHLGNFVEQKIQ